jgi:hypothetical protein
MIDMRNIYHDKAFQDALLIFNGKLIDQCKNISDCKWSVFKKPFLEYTQYKCPICEKQIGMYSDIDHYRPKGDGLYPFLKCCYQNYMIMCDDCNREYKKTQFPLYNNFKATNINEVYLEKPLLVNPMHDDIYELFELVFVNTVSSKKILILKPKDGLSDYLKKKAETTISVYGIGNCDENSNIKGCRIHVLETHYEMFLELAKLQKEYLEDNSVRNKQKLAKLLKNKTTLSRYGFYNFIKMNQFKIAV